MSINTKINTGFLFIILLHLNEQKQTLFIPKTESELSHIANIE